MTADEAKKIAVDEYQGLSKQFTEVEKYIMDSAINGNFSITVAGTLHQRIKKYLEELGYRVTVGNQYNDFYYTISWD